MSGCVFVWALNECRCPRTSRRVASEIRGDYDNRSDNVNRGTSMESDDGSSHISLFVGSVP